MNFLENIITQFQKGHVSDVKENSDDFIKKSVEPPTCAVKQHGNGIEEIMSPHSSYDDSEHDNTVDKFPSKKSEIQQDIEHTNNISNYKETIIDLEEFIDFLDNNKELEQNNTHNSEIKPTFPEKDDSSTVDLNDFEQFLQEFEIKRDRELAECDNIVDSVDNAALGVINEEIIVNLDEFGNFLANFNDPEENVTNHYNKRMLEESHSSNLNNKQLVNLRQFRKPKGYSNSEAPAHYFNTNTDSANIEQRTTYCKEAPEIQVIKPNNVEIFETLPDEIQTLPPNSMKSSINTAIVVDFTRQEDNVLEIEDAKFQNCIQDNKFEKTQDISISDFINVQNTGKLKHNSDNTAITSIDNIDQRKDTKCYKQEHDNITMAYANDRDAYEPTDIEIKLLSLETNIDNVDLDFCDGYHSSDFEFITESDAEIEGPLTNMSKCVDMNKNASPNKGINKPGSSKQNVVNNDTIRNCNKYKQSCQPGAGNSITNNSFNNNESYNAVNYRYTQHSRPNHIVPQGEEYLNLFQGLYAPMHTDMFFLENKSVRPQTCMNVEYEGIGFDMRMPRAEDSDEECKYEVSKTCSLTQFHLCSIQNYLALYIYFLLH